MDLDSAKHMVLALSLLDMDSHHWHHEQKIPMGVVATMCSVALPAGRVDESAIILGKSVQYSFLLIGLISHSSDFSF